MSICCADVRDETIFCTSCDSLFEDDITDNTTDLDKNDFIDETPVLVDSEENDNTIVLDDIGCRYRYIIKGYTNRKNDVLVKKRVNR